MCVFKIEQLFQDEGNSFVSKVKCNIIGLNLRSESHFRVTLVVKCSNNMHMQNSSTDLRQITTIISFLDSDRYQSKSHGTKYH